MYNIIQHVIVLNPLAKFILNKDICFFFFLLP